MNSSRAVSMVHHSELSRLTRLGLGKMRVWRRASGDASLRARTHVTSPRSEAPPGHHPANKPPPRVIDPANKPPPGHDPANKPPPRATHPADKPPLRAIDLARRIRQEKTQTRDSGVGGALRPPGSPQGSPLERRVSELRQFTLQLQSVHPNVLAKQLHKGLLLQNRDLVAINKPYGVPVHEGSGVKNNISSVLPILTQMLDGKRGTSPLYVCLGLDKEATGTLLLARSEEVVDYVQNLYKNCQVERKYWTVTLGVPVPSEGVIDIPVVERQVTGSQPHFKMSLSPVYRVSDSGEGVTRVKSRQHGHGAATRYRVLDSHGGCSLVELQPITGVKHQMRVHMAYGLGTPIIGDHKYSHWDKLAPQRLPVGVLRNLALEQSKVRFLPLHLHARQLTLPGFKGQGDITVSCPLPKFFVNTLSRLQITLPEKNPTTSD